MFRICFNSTATEVAQLSRPLMQAHHLQLEAVLLLVRRIIIVELDSWLRVWFMNSQWEACTLPWTTIRLEITIFKRLNIIPKHSQCFFIIRTTAPHLMVSQRISLMSHRTSSLMKLFWKVINSSFKIMAESAPKVRAGSITIIHRPTRHPYKMRATLMPLCMSSSYKGRTISLNSQAITHCPQC